MAKNLSVASTLRKVQNILSRVRERERDRDRERQRETETEREREREYSPMKDFSMLVLES